MRNIKLTLSYDGADFNGWQTQPNYRTVQETLETAIGDLTGERIRVNGSGRTDEWGWLRCELPLENFTMTYKAIGRGVKEAKLDLTKYKAGDVVNSEYEMATAPLVVARAHTPCPRSSTQTSF